ncbi:MULTISPECIES: mechanosensitive ion channel family protein [Clostridium]|jgi:small conductance mechanosensitive channel|uniref:mechanosensitive ion channel family protein n=1 Tax=Clostridium TaxID=1485 RepID=UPI00028879CD|nr:MULTISPECIES: mechanosensitive ion channel family protein [Clostridium]MDF2503241.1 small-conductance mechanosensitive channel [Clostridium sp.]
MISKLQAFGGIKIDLDNGGIKIGNINLNIYKGMIILLKVFIIIVVMYVLVKIGSTIIDKAVKKHNESRFFIDNKKSKTIGALLKSLLKYGVYFVGIIAILNITDVFGTISITFASIGGVAIGLGLQSIIKDVINGFFIIFENQFSVGDYIDVDNRGGIVESIELRVTKIRDFNGDLHIIPNGLIMKVTNHSRGSIRINVDICIDYGERTDKVIDAMNRACDKFSKISKDITEKPKVLGIVSFSGTGMNMRIAGKVKPSTQAQNENQLRKFIKDELDDSNIVITSNIKEVIIKEEKNA